MMLCDYETTRFRLYYDALYGVGYAVRLADGAETPLVTGTDIDELRRQLNRTRTNAGRKRRYSRPFDEIADAILGDYFPYPVSTTQQTIRRNQ